MTIKPTTKVPQGLWLVAVLLLKLAPIGRLDVRIRPNGPKNGPAPPKTVPKKPKI